MSCMKILNYRCADFLFEGTDDHTLFLHFAAIELTNLFPGLEFTHIGCGKAQLLHVAPPLGKGQSPARRKIQAIALKRMRAEAREMHRRISVLWCNDPR